MLVNNVIKKLEKFGEVTHAPRRTGERFGLIACNVTAVHQVQVRTFSAVETDPNGIQTQRIVAPIRPPTRRESLASAINWCLDVQYKKVVLASLCGLPIGVRVRIHHLTVNNVPHASVSSEVADPTATTIWASRLARSEFLSPDPEAVAVAHGVIEGNYPENALTDFLLEADPRFEAVWEAAKGLVTRAG